MPAKWTCCSAHRVRQLRSSQRNVTAQSGAKLRTGAAARIALASSRPCSGSVQAKVEVDHLADDAS